MEQQLVLMDMETSPPVRRLFLTMVDSMFHCLISNIAVAIGSNTNRHGTRPGVIITVTRDGSWTTQESLTRVTTL